MVDEVYVRVDPPELPKLVDVDDMVSLRLDCLFHARGEERSEGHARVVSLLVPVFMRLD